MQMAQALGGFSLGQADIMRRAMGKKKADLMAEQRGIFVEGCKNTNNIPEKLASELFDKIETFAGYGFNKSHSVAYAFVAYQTAYLKANYPAEFMCALLTSESGNLDKIALYVDECRRMGVEVLPPDVNKSIGSFSVEGNNIRFGLGAIKNVGEGPTRAIVTERESGGPFKDIYDMCARLDNRMCNRRLLESLNKAGAMLSTGWSRAQVDAALDAALEAGQSAARDRAAGQFSLFDMADTAEDLGMAHTRPEVPEWPEHDILAHEKEMLGLYISSHPLAKHAETIRRFNTLRLAEFKELKEGMEVTVGGMITTAKTFITQKGSKMAFLTVETLEGPCEVTVFSDLFETKGDLLTVDSILLLPCRVNYRKEEPSLIATDVIAVGEAEDRLVRAVHVRLDRLAQGEDGLNGALDEVAMVLGGASGPCDVYLHLAAGAHGEVVIHANEACRVAPGRKLREKLELILGEGNVWFSGGMGLPSHQPARSAPRDEPPWKRRRNAA